MGACRVIIFAVGEARYGFHHAVAVLRNYRSLAALEWKTRKSALSSRLFAAVWL